MQPLLSDGTQGNPCVTEIFVHLGLWPKQIDLQSELGPNDTIYQFFHS